MRQLAWLLILVLASFFLAPRLVRMREESGIGTVWQPEGSLKVAKHLSDKNMPRGIVELFVLGDCASCSYQAIPESVILESANAGFVVVVVRTGPDRQLPKVWTIPRHNLLAVRESDVAMPPSWQLHAPFRARATLSMDLRALIVEPIKDAK